MSEIAAADHPALRAWLDPAQGVLARIQAEMAAAQAHPARTVVLLPYAQLMPLAVRLWARACPSGFAPRFETTANWSRVLGGAALTPTDVQFDTGLDLLTAKALLKGARWAGQAEQLAQALVDMAHELGALAAAIPPEGRLAWMPQALAGARLGLELQALHMESALAQTAVTWVAHSAYASDVLFSPQAQDGVDLLILLQGFQQEPLWGALQTHWGKRARSLALTSGESHAAGDVQGHVAQDANDEALQTAALTVMHINLGRAPVALAATDRALIRRVRAMLAQQGVSIRDEQGWKLSTSQAGAHVMAVLRAAAWQVSSDRVLAWLKLAPAVDTLALQKSEHALRQQGGKHWPMQDGWTDEPEVLSLWQEVQAWRERLQHTRALVDWLEALREVLKASGQLESLSQDTAGQVMLEALHLSNAQGAWPEGLWQDLRLSLHDFTQWVSQVLEAVSFKPPYPHDEQVVILPMSQMLGRAFGAAVLAGCDELRLPAAPEPGGNWTARQREALGLPAREALQAQQWAVWQDALRTPKVDVLWRAHDDNGEPLLPSPLVQMRMLDAALPTTDVALPLRNLQACEPLPPAPHAPTLVPVRLSASAYEDLRRCPYRFFALRQLGLKPADELEQALDKRDFGLWLHSVLKLFHEAPPSADPLQRVQQLDAAAAQVQQDKHLPADEFLPFMAAWPRLRDGYLAWLSEHETSGAQFVAAEQWLNLQLPEVELVGQLDRLDLALVSSETGVQRVHLVMDYKTEPVATTKERVKHAFEDTQLAFYAALMPDAQRAAYVNVGEKTGTELVEQAALHEVREALVAGIRSDFQRMRAGAPMPALGDGKACQYCDARGLCRKDHWAGVAELEEGGA